MAGWSFSSVTKCFTKRVCHMSAVGSTRTFFSSKTAGTNWRPLIQPVTMPTMSLMLFFCATSQKKRKRRIISSSTPALFWSGLLFWRKAR